MTFAQLGVHGDIMLNSSLALVGIDLHFETGILRSQAEQAEVLFLNGAQTRGGAINTHSEVALRTVNSTRFDFPSGKQGVYLPFSLSANTAVTVSGKLKGSKRDQLLKKSGELMADLLDEELSASESETTVELNFAVLKLRHTTKRKKG